MLCLPRRRDAQVEGGAQRHGHGKSLLRSSARPEYLVEQIAEPRLEHIYLGLRDRHARGPVVDDAPLLKVVLRWPADARPRAGDDEEIVGQDTARRAAAQSARRDIAPESRRNAFRRNDRFLRQARFALTASTLSQWERIRSFRTLIAWQALAGPATGGQGRSREAVARHAPALTGWRRSGLLASKRSWLTRLSATKVSGRSNSTQSCITLGVMRPRSPRSRRTSP